MKQIEHILTEWRVVSRIVLMSLARSQICECKANRGDRGPYSDYCLVTKRCVISPDPSDNIHRERVDNEYRGHRADKPPGNQAGAFAWVVRHDAGKCAIWNIVGRVDDHQQITRHNRPDYFASLAQRRRGET